MSIYVCINTLLKESGMKQLRSNEITISQLFMDNFMDQYLLQPYDKVCIICHLETKVQHVKYCLLFLMNMNVLLKTFADLYDSVSILIIDQYLLLAHYLFTIHSNMFKVNICWIFTLDIQKSYQASHICLSIVL